MIVGGETASSTIILNHDYVVQIGTIIIVFLHSTKTFCSTLQMMLLNVGKA